MTTMGYVITVDLIRDVTPIGNRVHQEIGNSIVKLNGSNTHVYGVMASISDSKSLGQGSNPCRRAIGLVAQRKSIRLLSERSRYHNSPKPQIFFDESIVGIKISCIFVKQTN